MTTQRNVPTVYRYNDQLQLGTRVRVIEEQLADYDRRGTIVQIHEPIYDVQFEQDNRSGRRNAFDAAELETVSDTSAYTQ